ncbi:UxaA family hydrolase [Caldivirga maquilingensis]|uniref:SAF domain protein n=1 Tax=Caldivirga maquilingensis (strain ATCC 700844 / DSM 13496 / JCM 10307 / IC-167) TaxID=397948 RepID=A8MAM1_CALMQ|nr:UxaA family hydrolase [Caldivirga maquilingensis]ABW01057.1 SAF domain protein [Caldivirga maquilingensis IC-167]
MKAESTVKEAIVLSPSDNVAVALRDLKSGSLITLDVGSLRLTVKLIDNIPFGHKFALKDIPKCSLVVKYGHTIGRAKRDIKAGEHVHVHNLESLTSVHSVCRGEGA